MAREERLVGLSASSSQDGALYTIGASYNGSTTVSKTVSVGSIPPAPATEKPQHRLWFFCGSVWGGGEVTGSMTKRVSEVASSLVDFRASAGHLAPKATDSLAPAKKTPAALLVFLF